MTDLNVTVENPFGMISITSASRNLSSTHNVSRKESLCLQQAALSCIQEFVSGSCCFDLRMKSLLCFPVSLSCELCARDGVERMWAFPST